MSRKTDLAFVYEATNLLKLSVDQYSLMPHTTIIRIKEIIKELEEILEENE